MDQHLFAELAAIKNSISTKSGDQIKSEISALRQKLQAEQQGPMREVKEHIQQQLDQMSSQTGHSFTFHIKNERTADPATVQRGMDEIITALRSANWVAPQEDEQE